MVEIFNDEKLDDLDYKGLKIIQKKDGFCFGMDSVIIANFVRISRKNAVIADLGTGTGIISILVSAKNDVDKIYGFDIQEDMTEMASRSVKMNKLEDKIEMINADIVGLSKTDFKNKFDYVITNPPYKKMNTGIVNDNEKKLISRHEIKCTLENVIYEASKLLKDNGFFYMVHRPERLPDILVLMREHKIEPKEIQFVYPNVDTQAKLVLIKGAKYGKEYMKILEPLIVYEKNGEYSEKLLKFYKK